MNNLIVVALFLTTYFGFRPMVVTAPELMKALADLVHSLIGYTSESCS